MNPNLMHPKLIVVAAVVILIIAVCAASRQTRANGEALRKRCLGTFLSEEQLGCEPVG